VNQVLLRTADYKAIAEAVMEAADTCQSRGRCQTKPMWLPNPPRGQEQIISLWVQGPALEASVVPQEVEDSKAKEAGLRWLLCLSKTKGMEVTEVTTSSEVILASVGINKMSL
jgi:hypothetical protein